jgi:hypothetical protein
MLVGNLPAIGRPAEPEQIQALLTDVAAAAITAKDARRAESSCGGRRWRWVAFPTMCDRGLSRWSALVTRCSRPSGSSWRWDC